MLYDRRALLEHELVKAKHEASNMYLSIVVSGHDLNSVEYQAARDKISRLEFDLSMVNELIEKGQE